MYIITFSKGWGWFASRKHASGNMEYLHVDGTWRFCVFYFMRKRQMQAVIDRIIEF